MCKKDQLLEYSIQDIVDMISTDQNIEYDEAMNKFYNSEVFEKLIDKETGLYLESPEYVYDLFKTIKKRHPFKECAVFLH